MCHCTDAAPSDHSRAPSSPPPTRTTPAAAGEHWDVTEQSGTYYNCNPHFNYAMALYHSPVLRNVPVAPREGAGLELELGGVGSGGNGGRSGLGSGFGALL